MKYAILGMLLILTGCSMSMDEYESRVTYCKSKGYDVEVYYDNLVAGGKIVRGVYCTKDGAMFNSNPKD